MVGNSEVTMGQTSIALRGEDKTEFSLQTRDRAAVHAQVCPGNE
jgi:hypothetical protein